ncbi:rubrerythrin family protein [Bengtsoniella intestinalis]|uniref:rubrerythrin n=1 Tax=Bengtsoniella intestinalis TaxID=3073143 RepID=UPI00391F1FD9
MELQGSQTELNLRTAFAGETQARSKYTYFAAAAKKDGYNAISDLFTLTANNELAHAKLWFKALGALNDTPANLQSAINGEHYEWAEMYADFAKTAEEEGFLHLAAQFRGVATIEKQHEQHYQKALESIKNHTVFEKDSVVHWKCLHCGHIHSGKSAPLVCPVCQHPQAYFEVECC